MFSDADGRSTEGEQRSHCPADCFIEQAEDTLVPPLLRNRLTIMTFPFLSHYLPSRTVVLAIVFTV